jgi:putative ABC transport system substrate-binding protein
MDRRTFIGGLAWTFGAPRVATGQHASRIFRIGILVPGAMTSDMAGSDPPISSIKAFLRAMRERGYVYGKDFVTEARGGEGRAELYPKLVAELADIPVDVIVAAGPMLPAIKQANISIPVVMTAGADPVDEGFAKSLAHPGGNFTGLSLQLAETMGKRLEILREIVPGSSPVAVLWDRFNLPSWRAVEAAARTRGWKLVSLEIKEAGDIEGAFKTATGARAGALLVLPSGLVDRHAAGIVQLANANRLAAMYVLQRYVDAGGLMLYSADILAIWERAAYFVDRIGKGAKPADLPIEQPSTFKLVFNMKTANALGIEIPKLLQERATEILR